MTSRPSGGGTALLRWADRAPWALHRCVDAVSGGWLDPRMAVVASSAGSDRPPGWWLDRQSRPRAEVDLPSGPQTVRAREAAPRERARSWARSSSSSPTTSATLRAPSEIPIVILEPVDEGADA